MYEKYWAWKKVQDQLNRGKVFSGKLRTNAQYKYDAYIAVDGLVTDININGDLARNRALHGQQVYCVLNPQSEWNDFVIPSHVPLQSSSPMEKLNESLWQSRIAKDSFVSSQTVTEESHGIFKKLNNKIQTASLQPTGKIIYVPSENSPIVLAGTLSPINQKKLTEKDSYILFQPHDEKYRPLYIPRCEVPSSFQLNPLRYRTHTYLCKFHKWKHSKKFGTGHFIKPVGQAGEISVETQCLLLENNITQGEFSFEILKDLESNQDNFITKEEISKRRDLRKSRRIFTIDPTSARDLDDALHIVKLNDGTFEVGVHIADVSHFVIPSSALDKEAENRATTIYLVDQVIPMLPRILCEKLCSLNPNVDRLAFSVIWKMNVDGSLVKNSRPWFGKTVIRSCAKLDYGIAQRIIDGEFTKKIKESKWPVDRRPVTASIKDVMNDVLNLHTVAAARRRSRFKAGALSLNRVKLSFELNEDGMPLSVSSYPIGSSNQMIEEYMLLANYLVAEYLLLQLPERALCRYHPPPNVTKLQRVEEAASSVGVKLDTSSSSALNKSLESIKDEELKAVFQVMLTSPMKNAEYACANNNHSLGHYALNIPYYTHFTSPIRRYADVIVHRQLYAIVCKSRNYNDSSLYIASVADHCNEKRLGAKLAQEQSDYVFLCTYIKNNPCTVSAVVTGLGSKSFSVYVPSFGIEARLFIDKIGCKVVEERDDFLKIKKAKKNLKICFLKKIRLRVFVTPDVVPIKLQFTI